MFTEDWERENYELNERIEKLQQDLEASEYECFQERQRALIAESIVSGIYQKLESALILEIEGIEDVFEYIDNEEVIKAIRERLARMRKILKEGEE